MEFWGCLRGAAYFSANGLLFDSVLFDAKVHKDTTAPLVFTIYSGLGGNVNGNTALATVSVPSSEFNQEYTGGDAFAFGNASPFSYITPRLKPRGSSLPLKSLLI